MKPRVWEILAVTSSAGMDQKWISVHFLNVFDNEKLDGRGFYF